MKNFIGNLLILTVFAISANAQNIKVVSTDFGDDLSTKLGEERYNIDSLVITGNLGHTAFPVICDCVRNGKLTGIDMSQCNVENDSIPENGLMVTMQAHQVNEHCIKGLKLPRNLRAIGKHGLGHLHVSTLEIPSTLRVIDDKAFDFCWHISGTLDIPEGVESLGREAFYDWYSIENVKFPSSLKRIGYMSFSGLTSVNELKFNDGLEEIGDNAFERGLYNIKEIRIPESVTTIGKYAFYGEKYLDLVVLPSNLPNLTEGVFCDCFICDIVWPSNLETMEPYSIDNFTGRNLFLPEGLKEIKDNVFQNVDMASTITLPSTFEQIGANVFVNTSHLKAFYAKNPLPPILPVNTSIENSEWWFNNLPADAILYVPVGSAQLYRECVAFKKFRNITETTDFPTSINGIDQQSKTYNRQNDIYTLDGKKAGTEIKSLKEGVYLMNGKKCYIPSGCTAYSGKL